MKVLVGGASGLIGSHLVPALESKGHQVSRLVRRPTAAPDEIVWNPNGPVGDLSGFDAVIHLGGETIMGRWTAAKKRRILESRTVGTRNLAEALAPLGAGRSFLVASAIGYYGPHGDDFLTEDSPSGHDFLSLVGREWEHATEPARQAGVRVVNLRSGVVLTPAGGALKQMLTPFRLGVGGRVGSGRQWMSWIALDDLVAAIVFLLENPAISGAVNLVAPKPVTNADFTAALAVALHRPALLPVPATAVRLIFGEMGEATLLGSQRVAPKKLEAAGFKFRYSDVREALKAMLG